MFSNIKSCLQLEDFGLSSLNDFKTAFKKKIQGVEEFEIRKVLPEIELIATIDYKNETGDYGLLSDLICRISDISSAIPAESG